MTINKDNTNQQTTDLPELIIEAGRTEKHYWQDLWRYRELFYFLAWRDILVRYKQTAIGIAWALIRPFLTLVVFTVVLDNWQSYPLKVCHIQFLYFPLCYLGSFSQILCRSVVIV